MVAENKTKQNDASVELFLNTISDDVRRKDCNIVVDLMKQATGEQPKMWGASIVGFGLYHYRYDSGREGDSLRVGFSPRKTDITLYLTYATLSNEALVSRLGKYKVGKGCLYIKKVADIDVEVLKELIRQTYTEKRAYEASST